MLGHTTPHRGSQRNPCDIPYLMWPKLNTMKSLISAALLLFSLSAGAQGLGIGLGGQNPIPQNFPFPYNPDGNADGYIGLNDMLDLLSVYGQQYPESFYTDSSAAILNLGLMPPHVCIREARLAGPKWRMMTYDDYWNHFDLLAEMGQQWFDNESSNSDEYFLFFIQTGGGYHADALIYDQNSDELIGDEPGSQGFSFDVRASRRGVLTSPSTFYHYSKHCLLVTEVYPEIKYHIVNGYREAVQAEVADSLSNGWRLNGGISAYSSGNFQQAIWKYAE